MRLEAVDAEDMSQIMQDLVFKNATAEDCMASQGYRFDGGELVFFQDLDMGYVWDGHKLRSYFHYHPEGILQKFLGDFSTLFDGPDMMPIENDDDYPSDDRD